ncbi:thiol peroxidase [Peribacillus sp. TH16]|uniref:thiol peroxidase n=1 Tax=unclassified Peribacillus TaxID=2675266 RepID=UPI001914BD5A|nr:MULTISPECIES: thiol peroxidase [unclassified Peribacillus]MBK5482493.1 thiol peroxidase [Peribacillus sp. TH16]WMX58573.1 thiol peroxidase [Peribacillus sp. R9-11]
MPIERENSITFGGKPVTLIIQELKVGDIDPDFIALSENLQPYSLNDDKGSVHLISVIASIDAAAGICDMQTRSFNEEVAKMDNVEFLSVSVDLPFALSRWRKAAGLEKVKMLSDHRELSFGEALGVAMKELRLLARAIIVLDKDNKVTYVEYVTEATNHPDYAKAVVAVKNAADQ